MLSGIFSRSLGLRQMGERCRFFFIQYDNIIQMINVYMYIYIEREREKYERREKMNFYAKILAANEERFKRYT